MTGRTALPGGVPDTVPAALARAMASFGADHVIVRDRLGSLTLGELTEHLAGTLAALHRFGVRPGDRVAVSLPNDRTIMELFLATQCAGAVWVGIHEGLAERERSELLDDCTPTLYIGSDGRPGSIRPEEWVAAATDPSTGGTPTVDIDPHAIAAIAYTSGTTGRPKGVLHSQHNLLVPAASFAYAGRMVPNRRLGVAFPVTILNLMMQAFLGPLASGATCCMLSRRDAEGLLGQIAEHGVELISLVPTSAFDIVRNFPDAATRVPSLERVVVSGSHVRPELMHDLARTLDVVVEHGYGLTEAPGLVTLAEVGEPMTAGTALPHVTVEIRDESDRAVVGQDGEIVLVPRTEGPWAGVWRPSIGYWGRDDVPPGHPHELRTGDQGRLDEHGALTMLDRRTELILRGGSNVYPAEVERVVLEHAGVEGAVVVARPDDRLGQVPVAIVELREDTTVAARDLVEHCRTLLAGYKVPEVVVVPELKRNTMNKVERAWARTIAAQSRTKEND